MSFLRSSSFIDFLNLIPEAAILSNEAGEILITNLTAQALFQYPESEFKTVSVDDLVPLNIRELHPSMRDFFFKDPKPRFLEGRDLNLHAIKKNGDEFPMESALFGIQTDQGMIAVNLLRDISAQQAEQKLISEYAFVDSLTNLPNRRYFDANLERNAAKTRRHKQQMALLFIDLDKFKPINDNEGHEVGDAVLRELGSRISAAARDEDFVGRIGGDEFVLMIYPLEQPEQLNVISERILSACREPVIVEGTSYQLSASIGTAISRGDDFDEKKLLKEADQAMYAAKRKGGNCSANQDGF